MKKIVLAMTGASGAVYGIRLLQELKKDGCIVYLIISESAKRIIEHETDYDIEEIISLADEFFDEGNMFSKLASGSFRFDAAIIVPCSLKTLSAVANGYPHNLITRMAVCALKEERKLILVPRETPLDLISIQNMLKARENGAVILPAMPAFYYHPKSIDDLVIYIVGKIMDIIGIEHSLVERWKGK